MSYEMLRVSTPSKHYPILIGQGVLNNIEHSNLPHQICIVTDERVADLFLEQLKTILINASKTVITVILPAGEEAKSAQNLAQIYDKLVAAQFSRDACLIALGGGVIGDMAGFAAATYQRGMGFVQIPTTLLSQVDSSVGGKVAINHPKGKNMIGAFYQPDVVLIDTDTLNTLPVRQINAGLAEVIKYGAILDAEFLNALATKIPVLHEKNTNAPEIFKQIIKQCCQYKASIVEADETEKDSRMLLNFGHTFGHAIESLTDYQYFLHGEAISIGMLMACELSEKLGYISKTDVLQIESILSTANLPIEVERNAGITPNQIYDAMFYDKKVRKSELTLILLASIGKAEVKRQIDQTSILNAIKKRCE